VSRRIQPRGSDDLWKRFKEFGKVTSGFSREVSPLPNRFGELSEMAALNFKTTKMIFGKWSPEILFLLCGVENLGFEQIHRALKPIATRTLSRKLKTLENGGLIRRKVVDSRPLRVEYSITEKGLITAELGEPVFLFLRPGKET